LIHIKLPGLDFGPISASDAALALQANPLAVPPSLGSE
jgi:hypothetical protein